MNMNVNGDCEAWVSEYTGSIHIRIGNKNTAANGALWMDRSEAVKLRDALLKVCPLEEPAEA